MAISYIQDETSTTNSSTRVVTIAASGAGNLLVMLLGSRNVVTITSIIDNVGNTWVQVPGAYITTSLSGSTTDIWYVKNCLPGTTTVTVTASASMSLGGCTVAEYSGADPINPIDVVGTNGPNFGENPSQGPSLTTTNPGDILLEVIVPVNLAYSSVNSPWAFLASAGTGFDSVASYLPGSIGTYNAEFVSGSNNVFVSSGVAFKPAVISLVQSALSAEVPEPGTNPVTITIAPSGSGNLILIVVGLEIVTDTVSGITDNVGNTYIQVPNARSTNNVGGTIWSDIWYAKNVIAGATTINVVINPVPFGGAIAALEYSGADQVNPIETSGNLNGAGAFVGPNLTISNSESMLVEYIGGSHINPNAPNSPWSLVIRGSAYGSVAQYLPGVTGTYQATWPSSDDYVSSGVALLPASSILTLSLSDSVSLSDSPIIPSFNLSQNLADGISTSDSAPQSFSVQSDFLAPVIVPVVERLVNQLVPAHVKTYFKIVE